MKCGSLCCCGPCCYKLTAVAALGTSTACLIATILENVPVALATGGVTAGLMFCTVWGLGQRASAEERATHEKTTAFTV